MNEGHFGALAVQHFIDGEDLEFAKAAVLGFNEAGFDGLVLHLRGRLGQGEEEALQGLFAVSRSMTWPKSRTMATLTFMPPLTEIMARWLSDP